MQARPHWPWLLSAAWLPLVQACFSSLPPDVGGYSLPSSTFLSGCSLASLLFLLLAIKNTACYAHASQGLHVDRVQGHHCQNTPVSLQL